MAGNLMNEERWNILLTALRWRLAIILFPALKRNLGGHRFKEEIDMETVVTRWQIA